MLVDLKVACEFPQNNKVYKLLPNLSPHVICDQTGLWLSERYCTLNALPLYHFLHDVAHESNFQGISGALLNGKDIALRCRNNSLIIFCTRLHVFAFLVGLLAITSHWIYTLGYSESLSSVIIHHTKLPTRGIKIFRNS